ncbi:MAG: YkvA family protein [Negativicutes bacterium]|nr:YkvA family protein [Negativicutes bacterium]
MNGPNNGRAGPARPPDRTGRLPSGAMPWVLFVLALIYAVSPIDLVPDWPVVGWLDDLLLLLGTGLNLIEHRARLPNRPLLIAAIRWFKWLALAAGLSLLAVLAVAAVIFFR